MASCFTMSSASFLLFTSYQPSSLSSGSTLRELWPGDSSQRCSLRAPMAVRIQQMSLKLHSAAYQQKHFEHACLIMYFLTYDSVLYCTNILYMLLKYTEKRLLVDELKKIWHIITRQKFWYILLIYCDIILQYFRWSNWIKYASTFYKILILSFCLVAKLCSTLFDHRTVAY